MLGCRINIGRKVFPFGHLVAGTVAQSTEPDGAGGGGVGEVLTDAGAVGLVSIIGLGCTVTDLLEAGVHWWWGP